jgi:hypothetical protein
MKSLTKFINEQLFLTESIFDLIKKTKKQIDNDSDNSDIKIDDKTIDFSKIIDKINIKDNDKLIKDIVEILKKNVNSFKKIRPTLDKWDKSNYKNHPVYDWDVLIGDEECTKFIEKLIDILVDQYGWKSLRELGDYENDSEEPEEDTYNTAYIAFILSTISENL